jgi:hypothetical protein
MLMHSAEELLRLFERIKILASKPNANVPLSYEIQQELVERISRAEKRIRDLRRRLGIIRKWLATHREDRQRIQSLKPRQSQLVHEIDGARDFISTLRDVGDSIAFIYTDRWDIKPFLSRPHAGFISGKAGLEGELRLLRILFDQGENALLNDITNCMRVGDITLFLEGEMVPIEVKSSEAGKASARAKRQMAAGNQIMRFLAEDRATGLYRPGETVYRVASHSEPTDHTALLDQMLKAYVGGWVREQVEPGLHYIIADDPEDLAEKGNFAPDRRLRGYMVNQFKKGAFGHYPFPLSFRDPATLLRFYLGEFVIFVVFDLGVIEDGLREKGFMLETPAKESRSLHIRRIGGPALFEVTEQFIWRFVGEFLTLAWFIAELIHGCHGAERVKFNEETGFAEWPEEPN